ncbi:MAG TPA: SCP2 sterol-binding domain-containing protein [Solirubrobacteraceae bacterium]
MSRVRQAAGRWLAALDRHPSGHRLVVRALPGAIRRRFDPGSADGLEAVLELAVRDPQGEQADRFALSITDATCSVRPGAPEAPGARATIASDDLILLAAGLASWPELLSSGRFELSGDPFLALRFASLFRLPVELDPV